MVTGGFAEVGPDGLTVLADTAVPVEELDPAVIAGEIKDTEEDIADAKSDRERDKLRQKLEQLRAMQAALGQS
jgi:F-type H+-transporting ATPase subunit epsilon